MSELLSICCTSEPLYEIHEVKGAYPIGLCGNCREHTTFEAEIEEEEEKKETITVKCTGFLNGKNCSKEALVLYDSMPYCVKHYKVVSKKKRSQNESINRRNKK